MSRDDVTEPGADDDDESTRRQKAIEGFDSGIVDLLSWVLDTETRAKIYIYLQAEPASTSEEIAQGTGLYPSTVREALAELHDEGKVNREKRSASGAGNNPYEYTAIPPSDLVSGVVGQVQDELNTVFNLDDLLERDEDVVDSGETTDEPVTITVESDDGPSTLADDADDASDSEGDEGANDAFDGVDDSGGRDDDTPEE
ncbi:winged helix-turn-helix transcriptional regulator [Halorubellus sp. JP-L1]|uniref:helix-turn-helix domain-containing protein n=1 Tax=Halorubellus sp. JP-L1 TaxID=2715753 RepID=UPI00140BE25E|nr:helix-turn-helix domain-containing protein [Halorubellus sp. JP-L1]NHN40278.1 winged helix-turn-helix transcriptional regulator [Halorubellus sp. JP-L1]